MIKQVFVTVALTLMLFSSNVSANIGPQDLIQDVADKTNNKLSPFSG